MTTRVVKRAFALILALSLAAGTVPALAQESPSLYNFEKSQSYTPGQFADVPAGAWYAEGVSSAYELGLMKGTGAGAFSPTGSISVMETITLAARIHKTYYEGNATFATGTPWYQPYWDYAVKNGIVTEGQFTDTTAPATRAVFAQILANALPEEALEEINQVDSGAIADIPAGAGYEGAAYKLYRAGILTGSDAKGSFQPQSTITRSEVASIAARMAVEGSRKRVTLTTNAYLRQFDVIYPDSRVVVDGVVNLCDILEKDGKWYLYAADAKTALSAAVSGDFLELDSYAKAQNIRYQQDTVMTAAYFSTYLGYDSTAGKTDFDRAISAGLVDASWAAKRNETLTSTQYRAMLASFIQQVAPEKLSQFYANVTDHVVPLDREMGFIMAFYAAKCVGADYYNTEFYEETVGDSMYIDPTGELRQLFPSLSTPATCSFTYEGAEPNTWNDHVVAACLWALWYSSPISGARVFDLDGLDQRDKDPLTVEDGVNAIMRMYDGIYSEGLVALSDSRVTTPDKSVLTDALLAKAATAPAVTAENHPQWTGILLGTHEHEAGEKGGENLNPQVARYFGSSENFVRSVADWGFNSLRIVLEYDAFFNDDVTEAAPDMLKELDRYVAAAIQNNLHLNVVMYGLPGRNFHHSTETYTSVGDFDLYINESKWPAANRVWETLAKRYQAVPNAYLSFCPTEEVANANLSTGLPGAEYTGADVGRYALSAIDAIRAIDPDRLIIQESGAFDAGGSTTAEAQAFSQALNQIVLQRDNVLISYSRYAGGFGYSNMTDAEGQHVDNNNHSFYLVDYPTYWYSLSGYVMDEEVFPLESIEEGWPIDRTDSSERTLNIDSPLPKGTQVELYLNFSITMDSAGEGKILFQNGEGETVYQEGLEEAFYTEGERYTRYMRYAESDKKITFTLTEDVDSLKISAKNAWFGWSGMKLTLPEEYAVEKWYCATAYDVFLGLEAEEGLFLRKTREVLLWPGVEDAGHHAAITEDLTFTSEVIWDKTDESTNLADARAMAATAPRSGGRVEDGVLYAAKEGAMFRFAEDQSSAMNTYDLSRWEGNWEVLTGSKLIAGAEYADYNGACETLYPALLRLMQKYQNLER